MTRTSWVSFFPLSPSLLFRGYQFDVVVRISSEYYARSCSIVDYFALLRVTFDEKRVGTGVAVNSDHGHCFSMSSCGVANHLGNRNLIYRRPAGYRRILYLPSPGLIKALSAGTTGTTGTPGRRINRSGLPPYRVTSDAIDILDAFCIFSHP